MTCLHCQAREAIDAVTRQLCTELSDYRKIAITKSKAHWEEEMRKHECTCVELKEAV